MKIFICSREKRTNSKEKLTKKEKKMRRRSKINVKRWRKSNSIFTNSINTTCFFAHCFKNHLILYPTPIFQSNHKKRNSILLVRESNYKLLDLNIYFMRIDLSVGFLQTIRRVVVLHAEKIQVSDELQIL